MKQKNEEYDTKPAFDLMPASGIYEGLSRSGYDMPEAMREYIDNAFDELYRAIKEGRKIEHPHIKCTFDINKKEIIIEDNMGGIPFDHIEDILKPGRISQGKDATIGYFALGLKAAGLSMGDIVMVTHAYNEDLGTIIELKKDDLIFHAGKMVGDRFNGTYKLPDGHKYSIRPGVTRFYFRNLKSEHSFTTKDVLAFRERLGEIYGILVHEKYPDAKMTVEIIHDGVAKPYPVEFKDIDYFLSEFIGGEFSPHPDLNYIDTSKLPKRELERLLDDSSIKVKEIDGVTYIILNDDGDVTMRAVVGLAWHSKASLDYGADVYMNRRMISKYDLISFGGDEIAKPHWSISRMRSLIFIEGPASKTPSNFSKNKLDKANSLYVRLMRAISRLYSRYKDVGTVWENNLNSVLVIHKENVMAVNAKAVPCSNLDSVYTQISGEKRKEFFQKQIPELMSAWEKEPSRKPLIEYVKKNFTIPTASAIVHSPKKPKRPKTATPAENNAKISVRKTAQVTAFIKQSREILQTKFRKPNPTETEIIVESLRYFVMNAGGKS